MKIIVNKLIPFKGYAYINLFGIIFARKDARPISEESYNHEHIHLKQMQELLWIGFYLWYCIEYVIIRLFRLMDEQNDCYRDVSFEEEAHINASNFNYIKTRKHYAWLKWLKIGSNKK